MGSSKPYRAEVRTLCPARFAPLSARSAAALLSDGPEYNLAIAALRGGEGSRIVLLRAAPRHRRSLGNNTPISIYGMRSVPTHLFVDLPIVRDTGISGPLQPRQATGRNCRVYLGSQIGAG